MGMKPRDPSGRPLTLALPKGRILEVLAEIFGRVGLDISKVGKDRKLVYDLGRFVVILVRASDVPTYVAGGAADIGVAGYDVLKESDTDLFQPLDLQIAKCRMIVAKQEATPLPAARDHFRIATKYPRTAKEWVEENNYTADIMKLSGSVELGPLVGLADYIVDITETGSTLKANGLTECEHLFDISSRLVVNRSSWHLHKKEINSLITKLARKIK